MLSAAKSSLTYNDFLQAQAKSGKYLIEKMNLKKDHSKSDSTNFNPELHIIGNHLLCCDSWWWMVSQICGHLDYVDLMPTTFTAFIQRPDTR